MVVLSCFDGMSVARQALKQAGLKVDKYYASEIDKYAISVAQSNYPQTIQLGSITESETWDLPKIDLMIGGSPCQDLSIAKKNRQGLSGSRSGLFWDFINLRDKLKPTFFILENVASMPKDAKDIISEAVGCEPIMINASLVSAQNRKRLFWVCKWNSSNYEKLEVEQPEDRGILLRDILEPKVDEKYYIKDKSNTIRASGRNSGIDDRHNWDTIRIGSLNSGGQGDRVYSKDGKSVALSANGGGRGAKTGLYAIPVALRNRGQGKKPEYNGTNKANAMTRVQTDSMVEVEQQIRKLTPTECLRLQSMPDYYFDKAICNNKPISNTQRYKMCGNAFNCSVIEHILKYCDIKD